MADPLDCDTCHLLDASSFSKELVGPTETLLQINGRGHILLPCITREKIAKSTKKGCKICLLLHQAFLLIPNDIPLAQILLEPGSAPRLRWGTPRFEIEVHAGSYSTISDYFDYIKRGPYSTSSRASAALLQFSDSKDVPSRPDSDESFVFLRMCYARCIKEHTSCRRPQVTSARRLVDISGDSIRIIESEKTRKYPYAALSYCWGDERPLITVLENLAQMKRGVSWERVPPVFLDAAEVASKLGIRYLWIDALCIIQDDPLDWASESAKMASIYENAQITIAAASSETPLISFLRTRRSTLRRHSFHLDGCPVSFKARDSIRVGHHRSHPTDERDPLELRAWTMQERELSTRYISYTSSELQWACRSVSACECRFLDSGGTRKPTSMEKLQMMVPRTIYSPDKFPWRKMTESLEVGSSIYLYWHTIVMRYTRRKLTNPQDKLPAIHGMAVKFREQHQLDYISGLWRGNFPVDLAWARVSDGYHETIGFDPVETSSGPSFSWASIPGGITYQFARMDYPGKRSYYTKLIDFWTPSYTGFSFRSTMATRLRLHGPTTIGTLSFSDAQDESTYRIQVGSHVEKRVLIQFGLSIGQDHEIWLDAPISSTTITNKFDFTNHSLSKGPEDLSSQIQTMPVKLLSLFSLRDDEANTSHELILILVRLDEPKPAYKRLAIISASVKGEVSTSPAKPFDMFRHTTNGDLKEIIVEDVVLT